jgi:hypothetical protein
MNCKLCNGKLELIKGDGLYNIDHLQCEHCDSTYVIERNMKMTVKQFINKIIKEYSDHFKKPGNKTLGTLPNDWELELKEMLEHAFYAGRQYDASLNHVFYDSDDYLETLNNDN